MARDEEERLSKFYAGLYVKQEKEEDQDNIRNRRTSFVDKVIQ